MPKGVRLGGRQKGTQNKIKVDVAEKLRALGVDPFVSMANLAKGHANCIQCLGKGKCPQLNDKGKIVTAVCHRCHGLKTEPVPLEIQKDMAKELAKYVAPQLKAIEHTTPPDPAGRLRDNDLELARRLAFMLTSALKGQPAL